MASNSGTGLPLAHQYRDGFRIMFRRDFLTWLGAGAAWFGIYPSSRLIAQKANAEVETPSEAARASFEAFRRRDLDKFVDLFHPDAIAQFKAFAVKLFKHEPADAQLEKIRAMFKPLETTEAIEAASEKDVLKTFLNNSLEAIPGLDEILEGAKLQVLGEIAESADVVHVVTRTVLPRPSPVTCKRWKGQWRQLLNDDQMRLITAFEQRAHFRGKGLDPDRVRAQMKLDKIDVIGHVADGEDTAQVLCRIEGHVDDFKLPICACYPVRKGEPAWELLKSDDESKLIDALRAKWKN